MSAYGLGLYGVGPYSAAGVAVITAVLSMRFTLWAMTTDENLSIAATILPFQVSLLNEAIEDEEIE
jgi:hypothetical protein